MTPDELQVLERARRAGQLARALRDQRPLMRTWMVADSCILSTRMALAVAEYFSVPAVAVPVSVSAFNGEGFQQFVAWHLLSPEEQARTPQRLTGKAYAVGITGSGANRHTAEKGGRWDGHLVAIFEDNVWLDLSADQFHRPGKGINTEPLAALVPESWLTHGVAVLPTAWRSDARLVYRSMDNHGYRTAPDWQRPSKPHIGALIRAVRPAMEELNTR
jgi:hypothetical protein